MNADLSRFVPRWALCLGVVLPAALWSGCASRSEPVAVAAPGLLDRVTPYKVDVPQGNVVTRELVDRLKTGASREQVRDILGSPMLTDAFHAQRWDYVFSISRGGVTSQQYSVTVEFDGDQVNKIVAPFLPSEAELVSSLAQVKGKPARADETKPLELSADERGRLPAPVKVEAATGPKPQGVQRVYPPLETPR